jgi:phage baseplate assembly protein W
MNLWLLLIYKKLNFNTMAVTSYIFSDLNVRDEFVSDSTSVMLYDSKDVVQSVWRLLTTEEGEIPNFRNYGLSIKKYCQYPLSIDTIQEMYDYVKGKIETYETRVDVLRADVDVDFEQGLVIFDFYLVLKATSEMVKIPTWTVQVATS